MISREKICSHIGQFYLEKHNDDHDAAAKEVEKLRLRDIQLFEKLLVITLSRPGNLIGLKGSNIHALEKHLKGMKDVPSDLIIHIEECEDINYLVVPFNPRDLMPSSALRQVQEDQ